MQNRLWLRRWALAFLLLAPIATVSCVAMRYQKPRSVVASLLIAALEICLLAALTRSWRRFFIATWPMFVLAVPFTIYTAWFGLPPGHSLAQILAGTDLDEFVGFLGLPQGRELLALCTLVPAIYLYLAWGMRTDSASTAASHSIHPARPYSWTLLLLLLGATAYVARNPDELFDGIGYNPLTGTAMFLTGELPRTLAAANGGAVRKLPYGARRMERTEVHILVIGESARRDSWSVYGYARPTTPHLDKLADRAVFLQHAVSDANLTAYAVPILLTGLSPEHMSPALIHGTVVDLAKEAGYRTAWLVNQDIGISKSLGIHPDQLTFPAEIETNGWGRRTFDETLLPAFRSEIARSGQGRFIGIHMMGSHWEYKHRYPPAFQRFGDAKQTDVIAAFNNAVNGTQSVVDAYDNSVSYTDWFLGQLIESAQALTVPATLTYFADHGEDLQLLDGIAGHGAPQYTRHTFEIPAFVWMNDAYLKAHPAKAAALRANASKQVRSHDVFTTMADLMGIASPGLSATRSFASPDFTPDTSTRVIAGGILVNRDSATP